MATGGVSFGPHELRLRQTQKTPWEGIIVGRARASAVTPTRAGLPDHRIGDPAQYARKGRPTPATYLARLETCERVQAATKNTGAGDRIDIHGFMRIARQCTDADIQRLAAQRRRRALAQRAAERGACGPDRAAPSVQRERARLHLVEEGAVAAEARGAGGAICMGVHPRRAILPRRAARAGLEQVRHLVGRDLAQPVVPRPRSSPAVSAMRLARARGLSEGRLVMTGSFLDANSPGSCDGGRRVALMQVKVGPAPGPDPGHSPSTTLRTTAMRSAFGGWVPRNWFPGSGSRLKYSAPRSGS